MNEALIELVAANTAFVGTHFAMSHPLRTPLVKVLGDMGFQIAYSLVSIATLVWVYFAYKAAPAADLSGSGEIGKDEIEIKTDGLLQAVDSAIVGKFDKAPFQERLISAWPMVVQNVAQKTGKVKIVCPIPSVPGKYRFTVDVKSQDFLSADKDFSVEVDVVDVKSVKRKPKEDKDKKEGGKAAEAKKDE